VERKKHIIWDWNGTILNDTELGYGIMCDMLTKRSMPLFPFETYQRIMTFPITTYYTAAGFDFEKEPYKVLADEFIQSYAEGWRTQFIQPGVEDILIDIHSRGIKQSILSASDRAVLKEQLEYFGLEGYFDYCSARGDGYAHGKEELAAMHMQQGGFPPAECVYIGDVEKDSEIAGIMGCDCILVGYGHQHPEILKKTGRYYCGDVGALCKLLGEII